MKVKAIDSVEERQLRAEDPEGLVLGFSWYEPVPKPENPGQKNMIIGALVVAGVGAIVAATVSGLLGIVIIGGAGWLFFTATKEASPKKPDHVVNGMTFRADGQIMATDPAAAIIEDDKIKVKWFPLKRTIDDILSISMQPMKANDGTPYKHGRDREDPRAGYFAYFVVLDFSSGERFYAGQYFDEDEARIVVTQLNQALEKIRVARAELPVAAT